MKNNVTQNPTFSKESVQAVKKWIGKTITLIGVVHLIYGFITYRITWAKMFYEGFFNTADAQLGHSVAFWFIAFGWLTLLFGVFIHKYESLGQPLPAFLGWNFLILSLVGILMMPVSGWWFMLLPAIGAIRQARKVKRTETTKYINFKKH